MRLLNLGCGSRFHADWENVDISSTSPRVRTCDLRAGIPYPAVSFDVVYHSHLLEHLPKRFVPAFLRECHRVIKPGGVIRVAVPDLEKIARLYLEALQKASQELPGWRENYEWIMLEMYDQTVREQPCGECAEYLGREPFLNWDFVFARWGEEAKMTREYARRSSGAPTRAAAWMYALRTPGTVIRNKLARAIIGEEDWKHLEVGRFRASGEVHLWMYDAFSLSELLKGAGFTSPRQRSATDSQVPGWAEFSLDSGPDGRAYKPDSLFMEASRP